jgi:hypothetical protein
MLITADGVPTDSPISAAQRAKLKEDLLDKMNNLDVRISIIENEQKKK